MIYYNTPFLSGNEITVLRCITKSCIECMLRCVVECCAARVRDSVVVIYKAFRSIALVLIAVHACIKWKTAEVLRSS